MDLDGEEVLGLVGEFKNKTGLQRWQYQELKRALKAASDHCQAAKDLDPPIISNLVWTLMEKRCSHGDGAWMEMGPRLGNWLRTRPSA